MKKFVLLFVFSFVLVFHLIGSDAYQVERGFYIIDYPHANVPPHGSYSVSLRLQPNGGILMGFHFGFFEYFLLGVQYGGTGIVGYGTINPNPMPGIDLRVRLKDDDYYTPAIALGFNSQGYDDYLSGRYEIKSPGLYLVITKTAYFVFGNMYFTVGVNYSTETSDGDSDPNGWVGVSLYFPQGLSLITEYNLGINDNITTRGVGYLSFGLKWVYMNNLQMLFAFRDLLNNKGMGINRVISIMYTGYF